MSYTLFGQTFSSQADYMAALQETFRSHDTDESGTVDLEELSSLLKDVGLNVTDK